MARIAQGYFLIYLCALIDRIPWYEGGRWYLCGQRGCMHDLAKKGFELLEGRR
jgi:hypothetical protein